MNPAGSRAAATLRVWHAVQIGDTAAPNGHGNRVVPPPRAAVVGRGAVDLLAMVDDGLEIDAPTYEPRERRLVELAHARFCLDLALPAVLRAAATITAASSKAAPPSRAPAQETARARVPRSRWGHRRVHARKQRLSGKAPAINQTDQHKMVALLP